MSDGDTGNVGDGIERPGREHADFNAEIGRTRAWSGSLS
jgi:hypothetical protein